MTGLTASPARSAGSLELLGAIRPRLVLLIVLATGPLMALMVAGGLDNRRATVAAAERRLENQARLYAEQQDDVIQEARSMLSVLARAPVVNRFESAPCHLLLRGIERDRPRVAVLTVARSDGSVACSSRGETMPYGLADRAYFRRALASTNGAVVSEVVKGKSTGVPTVIVALPVRDGADAAIGVIAASLNLTSFLEAPGTAGGPAGQMVQVINLQDGAVLAQAGQAQAVQLQAGGAQPLPPGRAADPWVLEALRAQPGGGVAHVRDAGRVDRIVGYAPLPGTQNAIMVAVALQRDTVLAAANARLLLDLSGALLTALLAVLATWAVAHRTLVMPLHALARMAGRVGRGDLHSPREPMPGAPQELQVLADTFDEMTLDLLARNRQIETMSARLQSSEEHHRLLAEHSTDMITRFDASFIRQYASPACVELLGYDAAELVNRPADVIIHPADLPDVRRNLFRPLMGGAPSARATWRAIRKDGAHVWLESAGRRLPDGSGYVMVTRNVSERKAMEEQLEAANRLLRVQALQDPLTGVANRRRFDEAVGHEFRRAQRLQEPVCVIMLDIDHFKAFNDTYGHPAGDATLRMVALTIADLLRRPADLLARYGGEEFALVLPGTEQDGAMVLAERIRSAVESLAVPHTGAPGGVLTVSIGVAGIQPPIGLEGPAAFVEAADAALYLAKRDGRNTVRLAQSSALASPIALVSPGPARAGPPAG